MHADRGGTSEDEDEDEDDDDDFDNAMLLHTQPPELPQHIS